MLFIKNLIIFTLLSVRGNDASDSRTNKRLRTKTPARDLKSYETMATFATEEVKKDYENEKKVKGVSNTIHFVSNSNYVGKGGASKGTSSGNINYGYSKGKGKGSASDNNSYGYGKTDSQSKTVYGNHGYGKGDSKSAFFAKGSGNLSQSKVSVGGITKNVKTSPIGTRLPLDWKPWNGDGHQPTIKPTYFEPVVTSEPTVWNGDGHPTKPELVDTVRPTPNPSREPSTRPSSHPTDRPTKLPTDLPSKKPTRAPVRPVVTPNPTHAYYYTPAPTALEPLSTAKPTHYYIQPSPGYNVTKPMLPGGQFRKEVDEQCDEVAIGDPEACIVRCVTVTSIFDGDILIDETSRVSESSCLNKRQQNKQNNS